MTNSIETIIGNIDEGRIREDMLNSNAYAKGEVAFGVDIIKDVISATAESLDEEHELFDGEDAIRLIKHLDNLDDDGQEVINNFIDEFHPYEDALKTLWIRIRDGINPKTAEELKAETHAYAESLERNRREQRGMDGGTVTGRH